MKQNKHTFNLESKSLRFSNVFYLTDPFITIVLKGYNRIKIKIEETCKTALLLPGFVRVKLLRPSGRVVLYQKNYIGFSRNSFSK